jgi:acyl-CoA synthetase (NDP forming)
MFSIHEQKLTPKASASMTSNYSHFRKFFAPSVIAVVGATADTTRFGGKVMQRLGSFGATGSVYPVNPSTAEINGLKCYSSLLDLPEVPDHVGIMIPVTKVFDVLDDCAKLGVSFATIFSSGFTETGTADGIARQSRLVDFARDTGVRLMGPNCNGVINYVDGFAMTSSSTGAARRRAGNIGLAAQSGGAAQVNVMWRAQQIGLEFSYEVSCGNSADLDVLDFVDFMIEDPSTDVILTIAETFKSGEKLFAVAAKAAAVKKPIVALKLGRSDAGRLAAVSHTGALTGSDAAHEAAFRQCGIIRVNDCNELYEAAMLLRTKRLPQGNGLAALSASGGNAVLLADLGGQLEIEWPQYSEATQTALKALLPQHGQSNNPTDVTSAIIGKKDIYRKCVETIAADANIDAVIPILTLAVESDVVQINEAALVCDKPIVVLWTGGCANNPEITPASLVAQGTPVFRDAGSCLRAIRSAIDYAAFLKKNVTTRTRRERSALHDIGRAREIISAASGPLAEDKAKRVLAAYGFKSPYEAVAFDAAAAVAAARSANGRVALKIFSGDIPHKTEAGGVRLNLTGDEAVRGAFGDIVAAAKAYAPRAKIDGVLVQEMVGEGVEIILGVSQDPTFGHVLMAGMGGIYAEVLQDVAFRIGPLTPDDALVMLRELKAFKLLEGVRGQPRKDIGALCNAISDLSWLVHDCKDLIGEIDINPIVVQNEGRGIMVVDALIVPLSRPVAPKQDLNAAAARHAVRM